MNTQTQQILERLRSKPVVKAYEFPMILGILQYNARIFDLRKKGYNIVNSRAKIDGVTHSTFSLKDDLTS